MGNMNSRKEGDAEKGAGITTLAEDLVVLRNLAQQLHRMAPTADGPVIRAMLGRREALIGSIRARLAQSDALSDREQAKADLTSDERRSFREVISEIAEIDGRSARILTARSDDLAAEIRKVRAGKQWRENARSWK